MSGARIHPTAIIEPGAGNQPTQTVVAVTSTGDPSNDRTDPVSTSSRTRPATASGVGSKTSATAGSQSTGTTSWPRAWTARR